MSGILAKSVARQFAGKTSKFAETALAASGSSLSVAASKLITPPAQKLSVAPSSFAQPSSLLSSPSTTAAPQSRAIAAAAAAAAVEPSHVQASSVVSAPHVRRDLEDIDAWANDRGRMIVPRFWNGTPGWDVDAVVIDCSTMGLKDHLVWEQDAENPGQWTCRMDPESAVVRSLKQRMEHTFQEEGLVYVRKTGFKGAKELRAVMDICEVQSMRYEGGANLRPHFPGSENVNVYETGAPRDAHLHYHHEMAYVKESCQWIGFMCLEQTKNPFKGSSFASHQLKATDYLLETPLGRKLAEKGVCYVRKLPDRKFFEDNHLDTSIVYNFWQTSMLTEDMGEAEAMANKKGLEVEWVDSPVFGRYMVTKYYASAFEHCPHTDRNVLYSSVADDYMWFDSWPGVVNLPHEERPLKLNFGDDSVMTRQEKQEFVDAYDNFGFPIPWEQGDVALLCNFRTAHGRPAYELEKGEKRELGVVLGNLFGRKGAVDGKW
jgi:hypothetical protein